MLVINSLFPVTHFKVICPFVGSIVYYLFF